MTEDIGGQPRSKLIRAGYKNEPSTNASTHALLRTLEIEYPLLLQRLSRRVGSREAAAEALHDTYIKLRSGPNIGQVRNLRAYLYRMALNLSKNRKRNDSRIVFFANAAFLDLPDDAPSQDRVVEAAQEMRFAIAMLRSMSIKRQEIFLAKWRDDKTQAEIATQFGMHKRSVQKELAKAEASVREMLRRHVGV